LIYFIENTKTKLIKIGCSARHSLRFEELQAGEEGPLKGLGVIPGDFSKEMELHQRFAPFRRHGEWFHPHEELTNLIRDEAHSWTMPDDRRFNTLVRMDDELCDMARKLAALRGTSMAEMFAEMLRPLVKREWTKEVRKLKEEEGQ
jgi:hypothetical protein